MKRQIPLFLLTCETPSFSPSRAKRSFPFIDRTIRNVAGFIKSGYLLAESASTNGLLQNIDARIKIIFLLWYIVQVSMIRELQSQLYITGFLLLLFFLSHLSIIRIYQKILVISFFFGFLVVAPASLNLITDGKIILNLCHLQYERQFWIYHIPPEIGITSEGILIVAKLYLKIFNSITLTFLLIFTTPFHELIKALKVLKVPDMFLLIVTMTYKFIFILAHTVQETYFALKLRWWKKVKNDESERIIAGRIVYIFRKSWHRYEEVFLAMVARGFTGSVDLCYLGKIRRTDIYFLTVTLAVSLIIYAI